MAARKGVWAIDIGACSLKAMRLHEGQQGLEVIGFDYLEHPAILSSGQVEPAEKQQIIEQTLRTFLSQNEVGQEEVAISISGQNSFARFIKLPPVEPKKIPEVVQFEAVQQIPFDINEVEWDWQIMENPDSPDAEVGIFAIKNELIAEIMDHFTRENLRVSCVQIAPMALYNYAIYDRKELSESAKKAVVLMDVGAENTTLVICTRDSVWQRNIRIGGNTFTQAIADAFNVPFVKAEKLKRTAPVSKYMRQIYTAMRSVYTDFSGEIQRSLGFFSSSPQGRDKTFSQIIALGGGMKLQGLAKYLQQALGIPLIRPEGFEKLTLAPEVSAAKFHESVGDFAVVYGLGVQLLGQAKIKTNLLPRRIARQMAWTRKARWFTIAASVLTAALLLGMVRAYSDLRRYDAQEAVRREVQSSVQQVEEVIRAVSEQEARRQPLMDTFAKHKQLFEGRDLVPQLNELLLLALPNAQNTPSQAALFNAFESGNVAEVVKTPRAERKQIFLTRVIIESVPNVVTASFPTGDRTGGFRQPAMPMRGGTMPGVPMMPGMPMMPGVPMMPDMPTQGVPGMPPTRPDLRPMMPSLSGGEQPTEELPGFTILIEGFSPYQRLSELLDPAGVSDTPSKWGVITRLENLAKWMPNAPFELYQKQDIQHFRIETGWVDLTSGQTPAGIGILKEVERVPKEERTTATTPLGVGGITGQTQDRILVEMVLIDPFTQEEISRTYDIYTEQDIAKDPTLSRRDLGRKKYTQFGQEMFINRDQWFRIYAKLIWKKPQSQSEQTAQY